MPLLSLLEMKAALCSLLLLWPQWPQGWRRRAHLARCSGTRPVLECLLPGLPWEPFLSLCILHTDSLPLHSAMDEYALLEALRVLLTGLENRLPPTYSKAEVLRQGL